MTHELESLTLTARQRVERLSEPKITQAHFGQERELHQGPTRILGIREGGQESHRLLDGRIQKVRNRQGRETQTVGRGHLHRSHPSLISATAAGRAANEHIAQELHFDLLKTGPPTRLTLAALRIETKASGRHFIG